MKCEFNPSWDIEQEKYVQCIGPVKKYIVMTTSGKQQWGPYSWCEKHYKEKYPFYESVQVMIEDQKGGVR